MSWKSVNRVPFTIFEDASSCTVNEPIAKERTLSVASKFRVDILVAADSIVKSSSKRRKPSGKVSKATAEKTSISESSFTSRKTIPRHRQRTSPKRRIVMKPTPFASQIIDSQDFGSFTRTESSAQANMSVAIGNAERGREPIGQNSASVLLLETPCEERRATATTPSNVIEISSDDDLSFEGFGLSDEDLDQYLETPSGHGVLTRTVSNTPASDSSTRYKSRRIQHHAKLTAPPCPPFMHPNLFHHGFDFDTEDPAERTFTCFRAGEMLQLIKRLQSFGSNIISDVKIELFATVREVRFADSAGQGQGVVFADVFFPGQPPFITTTSKTPYSLQDLLPKSQESDSPRGLTRAVIACRFPSTHTRRTIIKSPRSRDDTGVPLSINLVNFEVQEVRHSSWEDVLEVRSMIAGDLRANSAKGQAATQVHDRTNANVETSALHLDDSLIEELTTVVNLSDADQ